MFETFSRTRASGGSVETPIRGTPRAPVKMFEPLLRGSVSNNPIAACMLALLLFPGAAALGAQPDRFGLPALQGPDRELAFRSGLFQCHSSANKTTLRYACLTIIRKRSFLNIRRSGVSAGGAQLGTEVVVGEMPPRLRPRRWVGPSCRARKRCR